MLEIRYNIQTKEVTGWWGNRHGNHHAKLKNRLWDAMVMLDIPIPDKPPEAWLYDEGTQSLVPNPNYVEPKPPRDLLVEIDELRAEIDVLKG